jgi:hypothetical protein
VLNALGGAYPQRDIEALFEQGVQVAQLPFPVSIEEVNSVIDRFIQIAADLL